VYLLCGLCCAGAPGSFDIALRSKVSWYKERSWMEECRDSDANSASRKRPGIIYVRERRADSIEVTEDWFFVMKLE
jgi:hypothetical protein